MRHALTGERRWMPWESPVEDWRPRCTLYGDALGYPLAFILTCGQRGDATQGIGLLKKATLPGSACLLDGGYDSNAIREYVLQEGGTAVIPPRTTRTSHIDFDKHTYKERHQVENLFQKLKRFRRVATRYEKHVALFAAMISIAAILIWIQQWFPRHSLAILLNQSLSIPLVRTESSHQANSLH